MATMKNPERFAETHPHLFHYTTGMGLQAILATRTLRATHIAFMNDDEEYEGYFRTRLPAVIERAALAYVSRHGVSADWQMHINRLGTSEAVARDLGQFLTTKLRERTKMHLPFVTSFCSHRDPSAVDHGLLSQWRGYGADGGYAIVFDTTKLLAAIDDEMEKYRYNSCFIAKVDYEYASENQSPLTKQSEAAIATYVSQWLSPIPEPAGEFGPIYEPMIHLPTTTKHSGFKEEDEVRLVVSIPSASMRAETHSEKPPFTVEHWSRDGLLVPFITLFRSKDWLLPIERIIVGPHPQAELRCKAASFLLNEAGYSARVELSRIPFRGR